MESFRGKLKTEWLYRKKFRTKEEAKQAVFEYIELFCNHKRLRTVNGCIPPLKIENEAGAKHRMGILTVYDYGARSRVSFMHPRLTIRQILNSGNGLCAVVQDYFYAVYLVCHVVQGLACWDHGCYADSVQIAVIGDGV